MVNFVDNLIHLKNALEKAKNYGLDLNKKADFDASILDYNKRRQLYYQNIVENSMKFIKDFKFEEVRVSEVDFFKLKNLMRIIENSYEKRDFDKLHEAVSECLDISRKGNIKNNNQEINLNFAPLEIKNEISADLDEIKKCFDNGCYRSAIILCGRVLEVGLHRKYFEKTGIDSLEKNPGIGLGKLIAKLREKEVQFDPGITQQIHLVNQVRISSVHIKKDAFNPTKEQTQAMILYTIDTLNRLFIK